MISAPRINLLRHPGWGMAQEGYGEDAHHLGEIGEALIRVIQHHMMACPRHFALNPPTVSDGTGTAIEANTTAW